MILVILDNKKRVSYLHRTATTIYPCCIPTLGDSTGAGRTRLTLGAKVRLISIDATECIQKA
jgi:hypothetical protein